MIQSIKVLLKNVPKRVILNNMTVKLCAERFVYHLLQNMNYNFNLYKVLYKAPPYFVLCIYKITL